MTVRQVAGKCDKEIDDSSLSRIAHFKVKHIIACQLRLIVDKRKRHIICVYVFYVSSLMPFHQAPRGGSLGQNNRNWLPDKRTSFQRTQVKSCEEWQLEVTEVKKKRNSVTDIPRGWIKGFCDAILDTVWEKGDIYAQIAFRLLRSLWFTAKLFNRQVSVISFALALCSINLELYSLSGLVSNWQQTALAPIKARWHLWMKMPLLLILSSLTLQLLVYFMGLQWHILQKRELKKKKKQGLRWIKKISASAITNLYPLFMHQFKEKLMACHKVQTVFFLLITL